MSQYTFNPSDYSVGDGLSALPWAERRGSDHSTKEIQDDTHGRHLVVALQNPDASTNYLAYTDPDGDANRDDAEVYIDMKASNDGGGSTTGRGFACIRTASSEVTQYELGTNYDEFATIAKRVTGSYTEINATGSAISPEARIGIRARVNGDTLKVKVWEASTLSTDPATEEPSSWTLTATDTSITGVDDIGFFLRGSGEGERRHIYFYGVGTNGDSAPTSSTGGSNPPNQPTATGATNIQDTQADLNSSTYSEPDGDPHQSSDWQVRAAGASDWTSPVFESLDDTTNLESITATGLSAGTQYEYRVRHTDTDGDSPWSGASSFTTSGVTVSETAQITATASPSGSESTSASETGQINGSGSPSGTESTSASEAGAVQGGGILNGIEAAIAIESAVLMSQGSLSGVEGAISSETGRIVGSGTISATESGVKALETGTISVAAQIRATESVSGVTRPETISTSVEELYQTEVTAVEKYQIETSVEAKYETFSEAEPKVQ